jgi:hypothetical protein
MDTTCPYRRQQFLELSCQPYPLDWPTLEDYVMWLMVTESENKKATEHGGGEPEQPGQRGRRGGLAPAYGGSGQKSCNC